MTLSKAISPSDEELLERAQVCGDGEAFGLLVRKYHPRVYNQILGGVKNPEVAKDLTQEVWFRAFRGIQGFRGDAAFSSWVYRIAENVVRDHFRREKHAHGREPLHLIDPSRITQTHPCPSQDVERAELREHLSAALAALTPMRREVFLLYYIDELPIKAIAKRLGRSEGTIKSHLRNARLDLQDRLRTESRSV